MYCRNCGREIPTEANFCPDCGSSIAEVRTQSGNYSATATIATGAFAIVASMFLERTIALIGIPFGIFAIISGIKLLKTPLLKKALLGMTFGLLAVIFGVIFIIQWGVQIKALNELSAKVEKNFSLVLPEREPDYALLYFDRYDDASFWANEYHFDLNDSEYEALLDQNLGWHLYENNSVAKHFSHFLGIEKGDYTCIDNNQEGLLVSDFEKREEFNYWALILDHENRILIIYEIWK